MSRGRIILLGASGQLGRSITRELAEGGNPYELVSYTHEQLDYTDTESISRAIKLWEEQAVAYDWTMVVNCAAFTQVDLAEDPAHYRDLLALNALLPAQLAESRLPIMQISTDYVFDGKQGTPYHEEDSTNPQSLYGRTKRQGELALLMHPTHPAEQHLVIRTQWLWAPWGHNFVRTMLRLAREGKPLRVVNDQIGSPTSAPSLARAICKIIACYDTERTFRTPLLHYADRGICSWYDFAYEAIATHVPEYDLSQLTAISTAEYPTAAERPAYSVLATDRITACYGITPPQWKDELQIAID
ncbi:dTDP-4-dehydrorhamnose reductase [uncultured Porphyromonas sp.]|uniref:dTDP-4-dehydrorhamnose reductase n=1 Tax=uncultured Porphyromonas sp. TaxID=159274 RepID=UPI0026069AEF|nr:dTDP-4-dehydrorhamnose reductase [uncultured Porphyromonas sp.]